MFVVLCSIFFATTPRFSPLTTDTWIVQVLMILPMGHIHILSAWETSTGTGFRTCFMPQTRPGTTLRGAKRSGGFFARNPTCLLASYSALFLVVVGTKGAPRGE